MGATRHSPASAMWCAACTSGILALPPRETGPESWLFCFAFPKMSCLSSCCCGSSWMKAGRGRSSSSRWSVKEQKWGCGWAWKLDAVCAADSSHRPPRPAVVSVLGSWLRQEIRKASCFALWDCAWVLEDVQAQWQELEIGTWCRRRSVKQRHVHPWLSPLAAY